MSKHKHKLDQIQRWMQAVITHPAGVHAGVTSADAQCQIEVLPTDLDRVVARRGALTEAQALAIYNRGYRARLLECFRAEFPILLYALGDELFDQFALDYLDHYPSRTHSLVYLCQDFPQHLSETRPDRELPSESRESWPDFIVDLARLERSFNEVFHGPGVEGHELPKGDFVRAIPAEQLLESRLTTVSCLKLHSFQYPVIDYFDAVRSQREPELPEPSKTYAALSRRDYTVRMNPMSHQKFAFLSALMQGETIRQATKNVPLPVRTSGKAMDDYISRRWLIDLADQAFVLAIE